MHNILEMKHYRKIQLIDILISNEKSLRIDELSNLLNASKTTVLRDIDILNRDYVDYIEVNTSDLNNLEISYENSEEIFYLQYLILNSSNNVNLLTEILINPFKTTKEYSNLLGLSLSHIYKGINQINKSLQQYRIKIISVNNKFFLDSKSEIILRKFFSVYLAETSNFKFEHTYKNTLNFTQLKKQSKNNDYQSFYFNNEYSNSFLLISSYRKEQGFYLNNNNYKNNMNDILEDDNEITQSLTYSPFDDNPYFNNRSFFSLSDYLSSLSTNNQDDNEIFFKIITKIYENEISQQIPAVLFIDKYLSFHCSIKKKELYAPINNIITNISKILQIKMNQYEPLLSYLLLVHFPDLLTNSSVKKIYILSSLSVTHAHFIKSILLKKLDTYLEFKVIEEEAFIATESIDNIYITNNASLNLRNKIIINDYPNKKDITNIRIKINQFFD